MTTKNSATPVRVIRCPRCRKSVRFDETNPHRPFCSALCKDEDIIGWAQESYRVAGPAVSDDDVEREASTRRPGSEREND
jgi:endogenous inhibitor of DNA gyrase (YacG/DUF329 family)